MSAPLRLFAVLLLLPLAGCSLGGSDASSDSPAAPRPKPSPTATPVPGGLESSFFGMHDADPVGASWPSEPVGSLRVWDAGVAWSQIETAPGVYDWTRLDAIVATAKEHKAAPLIVLGQTPTFHSTKPKKVGSYGAGAASMPDMAAWRAYVKAVVDRYNGPGVAFQVWNEANVEGYWNGTPKQMAQLTAAARAVVDKATPRPLLVAPALAVRTLGQRAILRDMYAESVAGVPLADMVDVVSLQLYPEAGLGPDRSGDLLFAARQTLDQLGVPKSKPIWNTEINYGLQGGVAATPASPEEQQARVAMTYVFNAALGIGRAYWYSWDLHKIADTDLTEADNVTPTAAGRAFGTVQRWLLGSKVTSCDRLHGGLWVCALETPTGGARSSGARSSRSTVRTAFNATTAERLGEPARALPLGGTTLQVGVTPLLVTRGSSSTSSLPPRI